MSCRKFWLTGQFRGRGSCFDWVAEIVWRPDLESPPQSYSRPRCIFLHLSSPLCPIRHHQRTLLSTDSTCLKFYVHCRSRPFCALGIEVGGLAFAEGSSPRSKDSVATQPTIDCTSNENGGAVLHMSTPAHSLRPVPISLREVRDKWLSMLCF